MSVRIQPSLNLPATQSLWTEQAFATSLGKPTFCHHRWQEIYRKEEQAQQTAPTAVPGILLSQNLRLPLGYPVEGRGTATSASKEMKELGAEEKRKKMKKH